jgi:undecaprenyl-diphosphatase
VDVIETLPPAPPALVDERLLPADLRQPAVAVAAGCAALLALLSALVVGTSTETPFDAYVERVIAGHHALRSQWPGLAIVAGEPVTVVTVAAVLAVWCAWRRRWRAAVMVVLGPGLTGLAETILKPVVGRSIPTGALAFPSGHTAGATAVGLVVSLVIAGYARRRRELWVLVGAVLTASGAAVVAVGLVAEHAHYPTDTIGGFCMAVVVTGVAAIVVDGVAEALRTRRARSVDSRALPHP